MNCPKCNEEMVSRGPGYNPTTGEWDDEDDHWWCQDCAEVVMFDEVEE